ncbi:MAG: T9SS type A sorting domain-containing protein [Saprospirales bacterium]|nr:T9SS type A sorting domain-containing protein [Saprospirales bacterium]MBK8489951.1 T9SS type A sorting domain-containing protein [Saprospirales bacterium]
MSSTKTIWLTIQTLLLTCTGLFSQVMYPGDANNSGVANGLDVLTIGQAYGLTGPTRMGATTDWMPQSIAPSQWAQTFPNGLNYAYADSNGDGIIDDLDITEGVQLNFLQEHTGNLIPDEYSTGGTPGSSPGLAAYGDKDVLFGLDTLHVDMRIGAGSMPVTGFYGVAFTVFFNPDLIQPDQANYFLPDIAWYDPSGTESTSMVIENPTAGRIDVAITRINQEGVDGFGSIGTMAFVIIEDVVGEFVEYDNFLSIENIKVIDQGLNDIQVFDTVEAKLTPVTEVWEPEWRLYPNPAAETVTLETGALNVQQVLILNSLGQEVQRYIPSGQQETYTIPIRNLPGGAYFLEVQGTKGRWVKKLIIRP